MKLLLQFLALLLVSVSAVAQSPPSASQPNTQIEQSGMSPMVSLDGKVVVEGGSAPAERATVMVVCGNEERGRASTDKKGEFMLNMAARDNERVGAQSMNTSLNNCELYAELSGYSSEHVHLFGEGSGGMVRAGTVVLHPLTAPQGATVSAGSLAAPEKAKQAFQKGQEQERKGKWDAAANYFKRAIQAYPRYALAWLELGRSQIKENELADAKQSFIRATDEDSRFVEAYAERARLAVGQKQWADVVESTERILSLQPDSSANLWLVNAAAHYNLGDLKNAESSALRGLHLDNKHQFPQLEYLYGLVLARRQDYKTAVEHIQAYLKLAPQAGDATVASRRMAEFQKLSQSAPSDGSDAGH